ncbi:NACHT and WD repeat domain-containing protein [Nocardia thailandica]|uniref:NACHT and WD repeat domain-containing protein n=1 Tax=Nocardia thailandica TaxID=257275 RepID=UPI0002DACE15|nr:AAA family ATPase [Nocardia thailandica]
MTIEDEESLSPRAVFAQRFAELYAAAGNPTLRRVATATERRMKGAGAAAPSPQRISDWKAGRNVPARFESLLPVVLTLIELARKSGRDLPRRLGDPHEWRRIWQSSVTWTADTADEGATCPYPGLRAYRAAERALFFGRERATTEFTDLVRRADGIVVLIGASGAGKSSLLAAGLVPALDGETVTVTPGAEPLARLRAALTPATRALVVDQFEELFTHCADESERAAYLAELAALAGRDDEPLAVVLALRADFYERCLHHPVLRDSLQHRGYVLGPMRIEEISRAITGPLTATGLKPEQGLEELVLTELRGLGGHAGTAPYDAGALPLLSHVMAATWQQREGRRLTVAGYRKAGGVTGSVAETAELAWSELTPAQQAAARELLGALVTVGQDSRDTRRTVARAELLNRSSDPRSAAEVVEILSRTRLLALDADSVQLSHEIVLDAWPRLRGWIDTDRVGLMVRQRLEHDAAEWAESARDPALLYRGTRLQAAREHTARSGVSGRAQDFLEHSARAARRGTRGRLVAAGAALALLATGLVAYDRGRLADARTADRDYAELVAAAARTRSTDPSLSAQLFLAAYRLRPDITSRSQLLTTQDTPLARTVPAHEHGISTLAVHPEGGLLVAIDSERNAYAWDITDPTQPHRVSDRFGAEIYRLEFIPGTRLAATDGPEGLQIWDLTRPAAPHVLHTFGVKGAQALAISPDGLVLAVATVDHLTIWGIDDRTHPVRLADHPIPGTTTQRLHFLRFGPDARTLAVGEWITAGENGTGSVQLWDLHDPRATHPVGARIPAPADSFWAMDISPDGTVLAIGGRAEFTSSSGRSAQVALWQIGDPAAPRLLGTPHQVGDEAVDTLDFSPDGRLLAIGSRDAGRIWSLADPAQPRPVGPALTITPGCDRFSTLYCKRGPRNLAFLPGGRTLLGAGDDGELRGWSLPQAWLDSIPTSALAPQFSDSGGRMIIQTRAGDVTIWNTADPDRPTPATAVAAPPDSGTAALSLDHRTLSLAGRNGRQVYALDDPRMPRQLAPWTASDTRSTVSGDRMLVEESGRAQLWDISDRDAPVRLGVPFATVTTETYGMYLSDDGARAVLVQGDSLLPATPPRIRVWDLHDPANPVHAGDVEATDRAALQPMRFLPDHRTLVVADSGRIRLWDTAAHDGPRPLTDWVLTDAGTIVSVSVDGTGSLLALSDDNGSIMLWDISNHRAPRRLTGPFGLAQGKSVSSALHPDGRHLVTVGYDGAVELWILDADEVGRRICVATGSALTEATWHRLVPDVPYRPPCP